MPLGPGPYDDLATYCMKQSDAEAVVLIVFGGNKGTHMGGKMRATFELAIVDGRIHRALPGVLRKIAAEIEANPAGAFIAHDD